MSSKYVLKNIPVSDQYVEGSYQYVCEVWRDANKPHAYRYINRENKNRNKLSGQTGKKHVFTVSDDKVAGRNAAYLRLYTTNLARFTFTFQIPPSGSGLDLQTAEDHVTIFQMEHPLFSSNEYRKGNSYGWDTPVTVKIRKDLVSSSAEGEDIFVCDCNYKEVVASGSWADYQQGKKYPPPSYPSTSFDDIPAGYRGFHIPNDFWPPTEKTLQSSSLFKRGETVLVAVVLDLQKQMGGRITSIFNTPVDGTAEREKDTSADWGLMEMSRHYPNYGLELSSEVAARGNENQIEIFDPQIGENITAVPDLYTSNFKIFTSQSLIENFEYPLSQPEFKLKALDTSFLFTWDPSDLTTPSGSIPGSGSENVTTLVSPQGKRYKSLPGGGMGQSKLVQAHIVPDFGRVKTFNEVGFLISKEVQSVQVENRSNLTDFYNKAHSIIL
jgi:hypothetical protein